MTEKALQSKIIKFLKKHKAIAFKMQTGTGVPMGFPDILFLYKGCWGAIEVKKHENSKFQPLQKITLDNLHAYSPTSFVSVIYNENYEDEIRKILDFFKQVDYNSEH